MSADATDPSAWQSIVSGNAELKLSSVAAGRTPALQMDFDFKGGGGFVVARRTLKQSMPAEYAVKFRLRGRGPVNHLELKLVDATGQNVWRYVHKDLRLPPRWKRMTVDSQDIDFAWGPSSGGRLATLGSMEFAIVAGEGGKGSLWIADVEIEDRTPKSAPTATASSALTNFAAPAALQSSGWKPRPDDPRPGTVPARRRTGEPCGRNRTVCRLDVLAGKADSRSGVLLRLYDLPLHRRNNRAASGRRGTG